MKTKYIVLIHLAFWVYMFNQVLLNLFMMPKEKTDAFEFYTIYPFVSFLTFYSFYFTYDLFFGRRNKLMPALVLAAVTLAMIPLRVAIEYLFWKYLGCGHLKPGTTLELSSSWWVYSVRMTIIYGIYALLIKLAIAWFDAQKARTELILEKKSGELALLRSQINPHFLFNTLNNIYSLVYKKSDDAPEAVMKMSSIMRYMLFDATTDQVPLEKEVEYLKSFIELEKLRIRQKDFVEFEMTGSAEERTIAPMLLIPFVENAFKHGSRSAGTPGIRISLVITPGEIRFSVVNHVRKALPQSADRVGGIGMNNIRRRLSLLYPGRHRLDIRADESTYHIELTLKS